MAGLGDIVEAREVNDQRSENPVIGSCSEPEENRVGAAGVKEDDDGNTAGASSDVTKSESILGATKKQKRIGSSSSCAGDGRTSAGVVAIKSGSGRWNGERLEDGDHGYRVGDFVWGKVKSHPWWPGQVYDPRDASEFAVKHSREGHLLVAFFGDGSCSWCLPSQLVPFVENFAQMSLDCSSKSFFDAIEKAVGEIGRLVESKMLCKCIPLERRGHVARPLVANTGLKKGTSVPEVDIGRLPISEFEPAEMLDKVVNFAKGVPVDNAFELGILRSRLSAFNCAERGSSLAAYSEPCHIEGLEDKDENKTGLAGFGDSVEVPSQGPQEDDWCSSPAVDCAKSEGLLDDRIYRRRKQKSVAELMGKGDDDKPKSEKTLKGLRTIDDASQGGSSSRNLGKKRSLEVSDSDDITEGKPKKLRVSVEAKEELESVSSPRERKKSKYLSPPYTDSSGKKRYSFSKVEPKLNKASSSVSMSEDDVASDEKLHKKLSFPVSDIDVLVSELLCELRFAALDPLYLRNKGSLDLVWSFISAYRSATFVHGSDHKAYQTMIKPSSGLEKEEVSPDDLLSDVRIIREKLDEMTAVLEEHCASFSREDKSSLSDEIKHLMANVEAASAKVRTVAES